MIKKVEEGWEYTMEKKISVNTVKGAIAIVSALIGSELEIISPAMILLIFLMMADYVSGMLAAKKEAVEHPGSKKYGWSSKKSIMGIYKKLGYILILLVAVSTDYILYALLGELGVENQLKTVFGLLVTVWLVINELISILENAGRMGVGLPKFLLGILAEIREEIDNYHEK